METNITTVTADIGDGPETFASLAAIRDAMHARVSGWVSGSEWYAKMRSKDGAKVLDAKGKVIARVSYNGRIWSANGKEEIVL